MNHPLVTVIIINWNRGRDTIECLESIYQIDYPKFQVVLLDNSSSDDSLQQIRDYCQGKITVSSPYFNYQSTNKPLKFGEYSKGQFTTGDGVSDVSHDLLLLKNDRNQGFAEGNNLAIEFSIQNLKPDYILLLNNDTVVEEEFLTELVKAAQNSDQIGFAGPKIYYYDYQGRKDVINFAGGYLNLNTGHSQSIGVGEVDTGQYDTLRRVDYVEGSCLLVKTPVLEEIGLLDPSFFAYWEETDLCTRGHQAGYDSVMVPQARIWHKISSSTPTPDRLYYYTRNKFFFMKKHASPGQYRNFLFYFFGFLFWKMNLTLLIDGIVDHETPHHKYFIKGVRHGLKGPQDQGGPG
ncbi:MAG: glycosyltransferase family 2 protein [Methanobacteriaceae archaeon]